MAVVIDIRATARQALAEIDKLKAKLTSLTTTKGWKDMLTGAAIGAGISAFNAVGAAVRGVGDAMVDAVAKTAEFEKAMLNVQSIARETPAGFAQMSDAVLELTRDLPQTASDLATALYDINSSGFQGAESLKVLEAAATAASAGLATTSDSVRAITAVLNAYGLGASDAAAVSDTLFQIVNRGVITFPELAAQIGKTTALSAPLGVSLNEVGAALAVLTKAGGDAENATTQVNAVLQSLLQPSAEATKLANQLGLGWNSSALEAKGLSGVLADMIEKTRGNKEAMATLLGDARAIRGAFVLAADGGKNFNDELAAMQDSAGTTADVLSIQKQGLSFQLQLLSNATDRLAIGVGTQLLPVIKEFVGVLQGVADASGVVAGAIDAVWSALKLAVPSLGLASQLAAQKELNQNLAETRDEVVMTRAELDKLNRSRKSIKVGAPEVDPGEWERLRDQLAKKAADAYKAITDGLARGRGPVEDAVKSLLEAAKNPLTENQRVMQYLGLLNSKMVADGLKSGDPYQRDAAQKLVSRVREALVALGQEALAVGFQISRALAASVSGPASFANVPASTFKALREYEDFIKNIGTSKFPMPDLGGGGAKDIKSLIATAKEARGTISDLRASLAELASSFNPDWKPKIITAEEAAESFRSAIGRSRDALDRLKVGSAASLKAVGDSFGKLKTAAASYYDVLHRRTLQSIEDARREINARYDAQVASIEAGVQAQRDALDAAQAARDEAQLRADVSSAASDQERIDAQQRLDDFLARQAVAAAEQTARAQIAVAEDARRKELDVQDGRERDATALYDAQKSALDKIFTATGSRLDEIGKLWTEKNKAVVASLRSFAAEYAAVGRELADAFGKSLGTVVVKPPKPAAETPKPGEQKPTAATGTRAPDVSITPQTLDTSDQTRTALGRIYDVTSDALDTLAALWREKNAVILDALAGYADDYEAAGRAIIEAFRRGLASGDTPTPEASAPVPGRASGGPVSKGKLYRVGERGPEYFRPTTSGTILPATEAPTISTSSSSSNVTLNATINVSGASDPESTAREIIRALKREANRQGVSLTPSGAF